MGNLYNFSLDNSTLPLNSKEFEGGIRRDTHSIIFDSYSMAILIPPELLELNRPGIPETRLCESCRLG